MFFWLRPVTCKNLLTHGVEARVGNVFSADLFYSLKENSFDLMEKYNIRGVEMEAALFI